MITAQTASINKQVSMADSVQKTNLTFNSVSAGNVTSDSATCSPKVSVACANKNNSTDTDINIHTYQLDPAPTAILSDAISNGVESLAYVQERQWQTNHNDLVLHPSKILLPPAVTAAVEITNITAQGKQYSSYLDEMKTVVDARTNDKKVEIHCDTTSNNSDKQNLDSEPPVAHFDQDKRIHENIKIKNIMHGFAAKKAVDKAKNQANAVNFYNRCSEIMTLKGFDNDINCDKIASTVYEKSNVHHYVTKSLIKKRKERQIIFRPNKIFKVEKDKNRFKIAVSLL
jgi:hypothetical protein